MKLSEQLKPNTQTTYSLSDGRGLELRLTPMEHAPGHSFTDMMASSTDIQLAIPSLKLKDARLIADKLRHQVALGTNPQTQKKKHEIQTLSLLLGAMSNS